MSHETVTIASFSTSTDEQIRAQARKILRTVDPKSLRGKYRRWLKNDRARIEDVGTFVWAQLCGWGRGGLSSAIKREAS